MQLHTLNPAQLRTIHPQAQTPPHHTTLGPPSPSLHHTSPPLYPLHCPHLLAYLQPASSGPPSRPRSSPPCLALLTQNTNIPHPGLNSLPHHAPLSLFPPPPPLCTPPSLLHQGIMVLYSLSILLLLLLLLLLPLACPGALCCSLAAGLLIVLAYFIVAASVGGWGGGAAVAAVAVAVGVGGGGGYRVCAACPSPAGPKWNVSCSVHAMQPGSAHMAC